MQPNGQPSELVERLSLVRLLALDVDGTLTDGRVSYLGDQEMQSFDVRDGLALSLLAHMGVKQVWITGRGSAATAKRAEELGVETLRVRSGHKGHLLREIQEGLGITTAATLAMGDDLPDLGLFSRAGVRACPGDSAPEVRRAADIVTLAAGGRGAVRELIERLARAKGLWRDLVERVGSP